MKTRLRAERLKAGLRVEDLEAAANVSWRTISRAELGNRIRLLQAMRLATALGREFGDLFVEDDRLNLAVPIPDKVPEAAS